MYKWYKWCISDLRSVRDRLKARGYPCAKGYNSSASQWLSGEQVRLCSGHPKVHFGTIVEGSWGRGGGGVHGRSTGLPDYQSRQWLQQQQQNNSLYSDPAKTTHQSLQVPAEEETSTHEVRGLYYLWRKLSLLTLLSVESRPSINLDSYYNSNNSKTTVSTVILQQQHNSLYSDPSTTTQQSLQWPCNNNTTVSTVTLQQ